MWRAEDGYLKRVVAVKEVRAPAELPLDRSDELTARILRDARTYVDLSRHPSIVTIHDVVVQDGRPWIVMELVEGRPLDRVVADSGPFTPRRTAEIGRRVLSALEAAHAVGVKHRGVDPSNVLVLPDGRALLTGFGIIVSDPETEPLLAERLPHSYSYVAPERLRSGEATAISDVWSLGATLFYAVEGHPAYDGPTAVGLSTATLEPAPRPQRRSGTLGPVLTEMMQRNPEHRLAGRALDEALERVASDVADSAGPTHLALSDDSAIPGATSAPPAESTEAPAETFADGSENTDGRDGPNTPTSWWPPRKGNWARLLTSAIAGLVTLILAPLLVGYIVETSFITPPSDPEPTSTPIAYGELTETPQGYTEHSMDGFSIMAPETWSPQEDEDGLTLSSPSETAYIRLVVLEANGVGPLEGLENAKEAPGKDDGLEETVFLDEVSHPDGDAARWTAQGKDGGLRMMLSVVALETGDKLAFAAVASPSEEWSSAEEQRRYAFESFGAAD